MSRKKKIVIFEISLPFVCFLSLRTILGGKSRSCNKFTTYDRSKATNFFFLFHTYISWQYRRCRSVQLQKFVAQNEKKKRRKKKDRHVECETTFSRVHSVWQPWRSMSSSPRLYNRFHHNKPRLALLLVDTNETHRDDSRFSPIDHSFVFLSELVYFVRNTKRLLASSLSASLHRCTIAFANLMASAESSFWLTNIQTPWVDITDSICWGIVAFSFLSLNDVTQWPRHLVRKFRKFPKEFSFIVSNSPSFFFFCSFRAATFVSFFSRNLEHFCEQWEFALQSFSRSPEQLIRPLEQKSLNAYEIPLQRDSENFFPVGDIEHLKKYANFRKRIFVEILCKNIRRFFAGSWIYENDFLFELLKILKGFVFIGYREVQITYITAGISVDTLREEMRTICGFGSAGPGSGPDQFTMKWIDDEGDPCRIASQHELDEALRLYELEKDTEITIHGQCLKITSLPRPSKYKSIEKYTNEISFAARSMIQTGIHDRIPKFQIFIGYY